MVLPKPLSLPPPPPPLAAAPWARAIQPSAATPTRAASLDWVDNDHPFATAQPPMHFRPPATAPNPQVHSNPALAAAAAVDRSQPPALMHARSSAVAHNVSHLDQGHPNFVHMQGTHLPHQLLRSPTQPTSQPQQPTPSLPVSRPAAIARSNMQQLVPPNSFHPQQHRLHSQQLHHHHHHQQQLRQQQHLHQQHQQQQQQQQQQIHHQQQAHQIHHHRLNLQPNSPHLHHQQPQSQLAAAAAAAAAQSRPLRPRLPPASVPANTSTQQQTVQMPALPLFSQSSHQVDSDLASASINPGNPAVTSSALLHAPAPASASASTDVLSVSNDHSQIGLSFATSTAATPLESYAQLSQPANADFWHTVIDQKGAAAAAAAAALKEQRKPTTAPTPTPVVSPPAAPSKSSPKKQMLACDLCGRVFGQRGSLGRHKKAVHMGVRPFPCSICGFCFQQRYDLRKHILSVHEHERPFACDFKGCKAAFSRRAKLRKHVTTVHLKQRDFVCEICNSAFGEKSNKTKHIRAVHLQERKYACSMCHAAFKERGHRTKHMLTQHNVQANADGTAINRPHVVVAPPNTNNTKPPP